LTVFTHLACSKKCIEPIFLENSKNGGKLLCLLLLYDIQRKEKESKGGSLEKMFKYIFI
jgi:hypothetical protein